MHVSSNDGRSGSPKAAQLPHPFSCCPFETQNISARDKGISPFPETTGTKRGPLHTHTSGYSTGETGSKRDCGTTGWGRGGEERSWEMRFLVREAHAWPSPADRVSRRMRTTPSFPMRAAHFSPSPVLFCPWQRTHTACRRDAIDPLQTSSYGKPIFAKSRVHQLTK